MEFFKFPLLICNQAQWVDSHITWPDSSSCLRISWFMSILNALWNISASSHATPILDWGFFGQQWTWACNPACPLGLHHARATSVSSSYFHCAGTLNDFIYQNNAFMYFSPSSHLTLFTLRVLHMWSPLTRFTLSMEWMGVRSWYRVESMQASTSLLLKVISYYSIDWFAMDFDVHISLCEGQSGAIGTVLLSAGCMACSVFFHLAHDHLHQREAHVSNNECQCSCKGYGLPSDQ